MCIDTSISLQILTKLVFFLYLLVELQPKYHIFFMPTSFKITPYLQKFIRKFNYFKMLLRFYIGQAENLCGFRLFTTIRLRDVMPNSAPNGWKD